MRREIFEYSDEPDSGIKNEQEIPLLGTADNSSQEARPTNSAGILTGSEGEPDYTLTDIGRVYMLKRIYGLLSLLLDKCDNLMLVSPNNKDVARLKKSIQNAKNLYILIANNIGLYKDKLNTLVDLFQKFLDEKVKEVNSVMETISKGQ